MWAEGLGQGRRQPTGRRRGVWGPERCWGNGVQQHTCVVEIPSLTSWVFVAQSPDGLQHTQPCAVLYYKPVNNSVLMVC